MAESVGGSLSPGTLTLEQLVALNDEIAALARAGMPMERGLIVVGRDISGRLSQTMVALGDRLSRGESLPQAIEAEGDRFPRLYRAVVEAGLKSGRLSVALEGLAGYARGYVEMRRALGLAFWYPMLVLLLANGLFVVLVTFVVPRFVAAFESLRVPMSGPLTLLSKLGPSAMVWGLVVPVVFILAILYWIWTGRAVSLQPGHTRPILRWVPWMNSMLIQSEAANFAGLLALLVEHGVPYPDAIKMAAEATGDRAIIRSGHDLSAAIALGASPDEAMQGGTAFPPLLRWLLAVGQRQGSLVVALRQMSALYRSRALHQAEKVRVLLPTLLLFVIGVSATLFYALTVFIPFTTLLRELTQPTGL